jgi:hypothetical protein
MVLQHKMEQIVARVSSVLKVHLKCKLVHLVNIRINKVSLHVKVVLKVTIVLLIFHMELKFRLVVS